MKGIGAGRPANASDRDADQLATDISSGWRNERDERDDSMGQYSNRQNSNYAEEPLDRGWERADAGYEQPSYSRTEYEKKIYGDDLYGVEDTSYEAEPVEEGPEELLDADGVYEADYRVIVPPSRPLDPEEDY